MSFPHHNRLLSSKSNGKHSAAETYENEPTDSVIPSLPHVTAEDVRRVIGGAERCVATYPLAALTSAFAAGILAALFLNRRE